MAKKGKKKSSEFLTDKELVDRMDIEATVKARNQLAKEYELIKDKNLSIAEYNTLKAQHNVFELIKSWELQILREIEQDCTKIDSWLRTLELVKQDLKSKKLSGLEWSKILNTLLGQIKVLIKKLELNKKIINANKGKGRTFTNENVSKQIERYFPELEEGVFNELDDFNRAKSVVYDYFTKGVEPANPIFVRNKNKKRLAKVLGEILKGNEINSISLEYLLFVKNSFKIYADEKIDTKKYNRSNLYKYLLGN